MIGVCQQSLLPVCPCGWGCLQVGVVSDYDLLALDQLGQTNNDKQLFPQADETWQVRHSPELHGRPGSSPFLADTPGWFGLAGLFAPMTWACRVVCSHDMCVHGQICHGPSCRALAAATAAAASRTTHTGRKAARRGPLDSWQHPLSNRRAVMLTALTAPP